MRINADSVRSDAKKLLQAAEACRVSADVCRNCQNELSLYWEGNAARAYGDSLARLQQKDRALERQIEELSALIIHVANEIEAEDRRIAEEAARRAAAQAQAAAAAAQAQAAAAASAEQARRAAQNAAEQARRAAQAQQAAEQARRAEQARQAAQAAAQKASASALGQLANNLVQGLLGKR